jgi:hypothetical protein
MNLFKQVWFWFLLFSILFLIAFIVMYIYLRTPSGTAGASTGSVPWYVWLVIGISALLFVIALILFFVWLAKYNKELRNCPKVLDQCGNVVGNYVKVDQCGNLESCKTDCVKTYSNPCPNPCSEPTQCEKIVVKPQCVEEVKVKVVSVDPCGNETCFVAPKMVDQCNPCNMDGSRTIAILPNEDVNLCRAFSTAKCPPRC